MHRNRTAIDMLSALEAEFVVVLILTLTIGLAISRYFWVAGDEMRRIDVKMRRRALRRFVA
jgi:hypothetical protein